MSCHIWFFGWRRTRLQIFFFALYFTFEALGRDALICCMLNNSESEKANGFFVFREVSSSLSLAYLWGVWGWAPAPYPPLNGGKDEGEGKMDSTMCLYFMQRKEKEARKGRQCVDLVFPRALLAINILSFFVWLILSQRKDVHHVSLPSWFYRGFFFTTLFPLRILGYRRSKTKK